MVKRVVRKKLEVPKFADIHELTPVSDFVMFTESGDDVDLSWMRGLDDAARIVNELNVYLRPQRSKRGVGNAILRYIRYVASVEGVISIYSLKDFRDYMDRHEKSHVNTKADIFSHARGFVRHLMSSKVLPEDNLPRNFQRTKAGNKQTFIDVCRYYLPELMRERTSEVDDIAKSLSIDVDQAMAYAFADGCMSRLSEYSKLRVEAVIQDWELVDGLIEGMPQEELAHLSNSDWKSQENKSVELAIKLLYAKFGRLLPASGDWPSGLVDFCKSKKVGWPGTRIQGALFPRIKTLDDFLVLALSDGELMPNVDSVAFYTYLDCCKPAHNKGCIDVHMGKKRGGAVNRELPENSFTVVALQVLSKRMLKLLMEVSGGMEILSQEEVSIMHHWSPATGKRTKIRTMDKSSTSNSVKRAIKAASKQFPELAPLVGEVTGENFRPTHAYMLKLSVGSDYKVKRALNHSHLLTTQGYISGVETQVEVNRKMQSFQRYLIDESKVEAGKRTGSGYFCGNVDDDSEDFDCVSNTKCSGCDGKRIVFGNPQIAAEWIAWKKKIEESEADLKVRNPARWAEFWEPKLVEYRALISLTKESVLRLAKEISMEVVLPCLD